MRAHRALVWACFYAIAFDGAEHPGYPIRTHIAPPAAEYSRLKALFRIILAIPIFIVQYTEPLVAPGAPLPA